MYGLKPAPFMARLASLINELKPLLFPSPACFLGIRANTHTLHGAACFLDIRVEAPALPGSGSERGPLLGCGEGGRYSLKT